MYVHILVQSFQTLTIYKEVFFSSASYDFIFWFSISIHKSIMLKFCLNRQNFLDLLSVQLFVLFLQDGFLSP